MYREPDFRPLAYFVIALGVVLSAAVALVPFFDVGYRLDVGVLFVGLLPYVVYGAFTQVVRGWPLAVAGALALAADVLIRLPDRFLRFDGSVNDVVYYPSLISALVVLPLVLGLGARLEQRWNEEERAASGRETTQADSPGRP